LRAPTSAEQLAGFETDVLVGFVLARVGRAREARMFDLDDVRWELGRFVKLGVSSRRELVKLPKDAADVW
jgi:hypothetical protein